MAEGEVKRKAVLTESWDAWKGLEASASPECPLRKMWIGVSVLDLWVGGGGVQASSRTVDQGVEENGAVWNAGPKETSRDVIGVNLKSCTCF